MMKKRERISVILPSYNEKRNLLRLIPRIKNALKHTADTEIIVVDDNSPDKTATALKTARFPGVTVIVRKKERGLATAILRGITEASGTVIVGMDADGNHDPRFLPDLLSRLTRADLVVGSRFLPGGGMDTAPRYWGSYWFNRWLTARGFPVSDATSGYYAIRRRQLARLPLMTIYRGYGEYHMRLTWYAKKHGLRITEVPVFYGNRRYGQSKSRLLIMLGTYMRTALQLTNHALHEKNAVSPSHSPGRNAAN
jgi:dolichol-phosphate mannosyltransferase